MESNMANVEMGKSLANNGNTADLMQFDRNVLGVNVKALVYRIL
jgi:hypothetical protein